MATTGSELERHGKAAEGMPASLRVGLVAAVCVVMAGALYLIAVRGDALLVDLAALGQRIFCF